MCLGEPYELHFYEPRYRLLIAEVMRDHPEEAKQGGHIENPPCFVHANRGCQETNPGTLVQVQRCEVFPDGRADVLLLPKAVRCSGLATVVMAAFFSLSNDSLIFNSGSAVYLD